MSASVRLTIPISREDLPDLYLRVYWDGSIQSNGDRCAAHNVTFTIFPGLEKVSIWNPRSRLATEGFGLDGIGLDGIADTLNSHAQGDGYGEDGIYVDGSSGVPNLVVNVPGIFRDGTYRFQICFVDEAENESARIEVILDVKGTTVRPPSNLRIKSLSAGSVTLEWIASPDLLGCS